MLLSILFPPIHFFSFYNAFLDFFLFFVIENKMRTNSSFAFTTVLRKPQLGIKTAAYWSLNIKCKGFKLQQFSGKTCADHRSA